MKILPFDSDRLIALARTSNVAVIRSVTKVGIPPYRGQSGTGCVSILSTYTIASIKIIEQRYVVIKWSSNKLPLIRETMNLM